ncbi:DNA cytosine methyltransferase [Caulobacter sp. Root1472]|uniref:DNA cytosine methyltransferase n=1 Tax=Caulobacter sp. Root1472 TaxID=1736470 RepID=UPI0006FEF3F4|nr:DNA cytosine methyltransferase [Caulobacter sp. Root1472]KQZ22086.1 DNA methyltransferase [Caulobacter sp. Root1472]
MKVAGLFAGVGGFESGMAAAGHHAELLCEILPSAQAVLKARFPDVEIKDDVRRLKSLPADVEVLCAGFPCQDLSQAGQTRGLDGERSGLVDHVLTLLRTERPKWLVLENVPFMLQLNGGDAMRRIVEAIEDVKGYRWAWRVLDTFGFGLPQRRERVYLVASRVADPADVLLSDDVAFARPQTAIGKLAHGFYWTEGRGGLGWAVDAVPTLKNGSTIGIPSPPAILLPSKEIIKPDIRDAERLQGFEADWTLAAETVGKKSARWSLVGSAVSIPVAKWVGQRLASPGAYDMERDGIFPNVGKLPRAARYDGKTRHAVSIGADPLGIVAPHLADFLQYPGEPLSQRATAGFLGRTRVAKLRFQDGFIRAVERHLERVSDAPPPARRAA